MCVVTVTPATSFLTPQCSLPRNLTGTWITQGVQYMSNIRINDTHIYFNTRINEYEYQETYYSCQQSQGTRYLMTKVVVGKWYDSILFVFMCNQHLLTFLRKKGKQFCKENAVSVKQYYDAFCTWKEDQKLNNIDLYTIQYIQTTDRF